MTIDEQGAVQRWWEGVAARVEALLNGGGEVEVRVELGADAEEEGRPIEVLRPGTFTDRFGREVVIEEGDLQTFVTHFQEGAAGQDVPVDVDHEGAQAAGWVRALYVEGSRLLARVEWTALGRQLVGERLYRYVSASIDLGRRVIRAVSLVNFPAVKGLAPVELAERSGDRPEQEDAMTDEERAALEAQIREEERAKVAAELSQRQEQEVELRARIREEERSAIAAEMAERAAMVEFAEGLCSPGEGLGLGMTVDQVVEVLARVPAEVRGDVERLLQARVVAFGEVGSSRGGVAQLKALPETYRVSLRKWIKAGQSVADFFEEVAPDLGDVDGYVLSEWTV